MWAPNKKPPSKAERDHIELIKSMPCAVCDDPPPSDAHEIEQGLWWLSIPLCRDCHRGGFNGIHGQRRIWTVKELTELKALNETIRRLFTSLS